MPATALLSLASVSFTHPVSDTLAKDSNAVAGIRILESKVLLALMRGRLPHPPPAHRGETAQ